ncbi:hypothetical protein VTP01DRAFT_7459 [Rhizomucor pusillus]|uniref:uncharacterized protein n=1 Tax=Rhizomucor pusillus TaxID=4840 RepID=UPI003743E97C
MATIPIIDFGNFSARSAEIAKQVFDACSNIGFFYVTNHPVRQELVDRAFQISKEFYDLPYEEKNMYAIMNNRGYTGMFVQKLDPRHQRQGDTKEAFNFGPFRNGSSQQPLPAVFEEKKIAIQQFWSACNETSKQIVEAFAIALEASLIPEEHGGKKWFSQRHAYDNPQANPTLRFLKYPCGEKNSFSEPVRAGAHTDYGSITLFQKDVPGLEVQASRTEWISAPIIEGSILVNVGRILEYWTNGLFKSTVHRVVFIPEHQEMDRYSIACFNQPLRDATLAPIPSSIVPEDAVVQQEVGIPPGKILTSAEYLQLRLDAAYVSATNAQAVKVQ